MRKARRTWERIDFRTISLQIKHSIDATRKFLSCNVPSDVKNYGFEHLRVNKTRIHRPHMKSTFVGMLFKRYGAGNFMFNCLQYADTHKT